MMDATQHARELLAMGARPGSARTRVSALTKAVVGACVAVPARVSVHDLHREQITAVQLGDLYRGLGAGRSAYEGHPMFGRGTGLSISTSAWYAC
jgi:hypothetical protein